MLVGFDEFDAAPVADSALGSLALHSTASAAITAELGAVAFCFQAVALGYIAGNAGEGPRHGLFQ
jgi:hypothetical protein